MAAGLVALLAAAVIQQWQNQRVADNRLVALAAAHPADAGMYVALVVLVTQFSAAVVRHPADIRASGDVVLVAAALNHWHWHPAVWAPFSAAVVRQWHPADVRILGATGGAAKRRLVVHRDGDGRTASADWWPRRGSWSVWTAATCDALLSQRRSCAWSAWPWRSSAWRWT